MAERAATKGVKLLLLQNPREVMEQQASGVAFSPLACLDATIEHSGALAARVMLRSFVIPNAELLPAELLPEDQRSGVETWSDYIDYWAVDWDSRTETLAPGWVAYRTRKQRDSLWSLNCTNTRRPGRRHIVVHVVDIFGNETKQAFDVEVTDQQP